MPDSDWQMIVQGYTPEKKKWDRTFPWLGFVVRPLSFPVAWIFMKARVSANAVTAFDGIVYLAALAMLAFPSPQVRVAGAVLFFLGNLLDCVDGDLARARRSESLSGRYLDNMVGYIVYMVYAFLGFGLAFDADIYGSLGCCPVSRPLFILAAGAAASLARFATFGLRDSYGLVLREQWGKFRMASGSAENQPAGSGRTHIGVYHNLTDIQGHDFIMVLALLYGFGVEFLVVSASLQCAGLAAEALVFARRAVLLGRKSS